MSRKNNRKTYKGKKLFLYGRLSQNKAVAYCKLHKCYLEPIDILEKNCNKKKCRHKINLGGGIRYDKNRKTNNK